MAAASSLVAARDRGDLHTVAAAAMGADGRIVTGLNLFHFTGGPCAELVALANAAAEGLDRLACVVAVGDGDRGVIAPCGRCRQVLVDRHPGIRVVLPVDGGLAVLPVEDLLPWAYHPRDEP